ncbi:MAG: hypothetical protein RLZZ225_307 [Pseudomonadota bacterium]|jgi:hypothetical protein
MVNLPHLVPHIALGNTDYSDSAKRYMENKKPLWNSFNSLIEQAVRDQKAFLYKELNEEMRWALGIAALREKKELAIDAEFDKLNELIADVLESKGSYNSLRRLYDEIVATMIESKPSREAHVAYYIDTALEKEKDKRAFCAAYEQEEKGGFYEEDHSF